MKDIEQYVIDCYADMEMIDFLLDHIEDYDKVLKERHVKFVVSYRLYKRSLKMVAATHNFSINDIKRIFWRVQKKLLLEFIDRVNVGKIKTNSLPSNFDSFLLWSLEQFRDDAQSVYSYIKKKMTYQYNIDGVTHKRKEQIENVLNELSRYDNLEIVLPKTVFPIAKDLLNGQSLIDTAKKHNKSFNYLVSSIVGRKNARKQSERGWLSYLNKEKAENFPINKVIKFPNF